MNIAFHIPAWLLWTVAGILVGVVLGFALFGILFLRAYRGGGLF